MNTVRIFISSPGDVAEERERARQVVEQLRGQYAGQLDLKAVLWEDLPLQADMTFQQGIDQVLSREHGVDIAVFILWSRLGSPLGAFILKPDGSNYRSGTEREFDLMLAARKRSQTGTPRILVYTRRDNASFLERLRDKRTDEQHDLISQKKLLESFIQENFHDTDSRTNLRAYHSFDQPVTFSQRLRAHLQEILNELARLTTARPVWDIAKQGAPFLGLNHFDFTHSAVFFGREDPILEVRRALREKAKQGCAFVLISGASGSGKSSLARAGVLPAIVEHELDNMVAGWRVAACSPSQLGADLSAGLARLLCSEDVLPELRVGADFDVVLAKGLAKEPELTIEQSLRPALARASSASRRANRLVLLIDQLEELFTDKQRTDADRERFAAVLEALARSGVVWVLATARSDFYQHCQRLTALMRMKEGPGQIDLLPPMPDALRRLIEHPARLAGLSFEQRNGRSLADRILADATAHAELLPLVSYLLRELFEQRTPEGVLTWNAYEELGGVEGALAKRADKIFGELPGDVQSELPNVLNKVVSITGDEEESAVRQFASLDAFPPGTAARTLVDRFVQERFLVAEIEDCDGRAKATGVVTVAHEALLRVWTRASQWIEENREFLRVRTRVAARMREGGLLLEGDPLLDLAQFHFNTTPAGFTPDQTRYIQASIGAVQKRRRRRRAAVAAVLSLIFAVVILWQRQRIADAREAAEAARRVASETDFTLAADEIQKNNVRVSLAYLADALRKNTNNQDAAALAISILQNCPVPAMTFRHGDEVQDASFSPDGQQLATASADKTARLWKSASGAEIAAVTGHTDWVHTVSFSPDGDWMVTASWDGTARVWNTRTGAARTNSQNNQPVVMVHSNKVTAARFSPDGLWIVTSCWDGKARIWNARTGEPLLKPQGRGPVELSHQGVVWSAYFSPDGKRVVTASADTTARVWNAQTGQAITNGRGEDIVLRHPGQVNGAEFSPDGQWIVTASDNKGTASDFGEARVWNAKTGEAAVNPKDGTEIVFRHALPVNFATFSPDGKRIVTASSDDTACVWDIRTNAPISAAMRHQGWVRVARFSPDGRWVVTGSADGTARLWDAATGRPASNPMCHGSAVYMANFSPDGKWIVTASFDGFGREWGVRSSEQSEVLNHGGLVASAAFSPDGQWVVTASDDGTARVWNARTGQARTNSDQQPVVMRHDGKVLVVAFSPNGNQIVTGTTNAAYLWNGVTGKQIEKLESPNSEVTHACFSRDCQSLVTSGSDGSARLWNGVTGQALLNSGTREPLMLRTPANSTICAVDFNPAGTRVAIASEDGFARIWDAQTCEMLQRFRHDGIVTSARFSPDGRTLLTASADHRAQLWDAASGAPVHGPMRHDGWVYDAEFSPDGKWIVTASGDGTARVWDARDSHPVSEPMRHRNAVIVASFSPDAERVVTASWDGSSRIWDAQTGKPISESMQDADKDTTASFSPDGQWILTASLDGTARMWQSAITNRSAPRWLIELAEAVGGLHLNPQGVLEPATQDPVALRAQLSGLAGGDDISRFARWFVADPATRTISPLSSITIPEFVEQRLDEDTAQSVEEAYDADPGNPLVLASVAQFTDDRDKRLFYCRLALERARNEHLPPEQIQRVQSLTHALFPNPAEVEGKTSLNGP